MSTCRDHKEPNILFHVARVRTFFLIKNYQRLQYHMKVLSTVGYKQLFVNEIFR